MEKGPKRGKMSKGLGRNGITTECPAFACMKAGLFTQRSGIYSRKIDDKGWDSCFLSVGMIVW